MKSQKLFQLLMGMLFFLFAFQQMEAQNVKEDSLLQLLDQATDQQSIDLYLNLWEATAYNNPAKAADYADQALQLSEKLNDELNIGNAFQKMAGGFLNENNLDKAEEYYKLSSNRFEAVNHVPGLMNNRYNEAIIHYYRAQYQDAIDDFNASIEMGSEVGDSLHIAAVLNSIGLIHNQQGDFVLGEQALYKAVRLFRNSPDRARYADALNYLTASLVGQGYHERAVEILKQAIEIYEDLGDKVFLANSENDLGYNLIFLDEFEEAKKHLYRCLEIAKEVNGELLIGTVYSNLALIKEKETDLDSALYFLSLSKPMFKKLDLIQKYRADQLHIARIYMRQDRKAEAEKILNEVIPAIDTLPFKDLQLETYNNMAILQSDKGNYRLALEYREKTATVKDSIINQEKARALAEMRTIFETAEKDREIDVLEGRLKLTS